MQKAKSGLAPVVSAGAPAESAKANLPDHGFLPGNQTMADSAYVFAACSLFSSREGNQKSGPKILRLERKPLLEPHRT